jgi:hypothetical protein
VWILYIMLFVAAPGPHMAENKKVWTFQSATAMEFENDGLCEQAYNDILKSVSNTDTITVRAWCFPNSSDSATATHKLTPDSKKQLPPSIQLPTKP